MGQQAYSFIFGNTFDGYISYFKYSSGITEFDRASKACSSCSGPLSWATCSHQTDFENQIVMLISSPTLQIKEYAKLVLLTVLALSYLLNVPLFLNAIAGDVRYDLGLLLKIVPNAGPDMNFRVLYLSSNAYVLSTSSLFV